MEVYFDIYFKATKFCWEGRFVYNWTDMKLVLFTTKVDKGGREIIKEARKMSLACQTYFCEDLIYKDDEIFNLNHNPLSIHQNDKIILRDPYNTTHDYSSFTKKIVEKYYKNILLDRERYSKFPLCEDKLFQANLFTKLEIIIPEVFLNGHIKKPLKFPVIVKPRVGSRELQGFFYVSI